MINGYRLDWHALLAALLLAVGLGLSAAPRPSAPDPLPSWNEGPTKQAIMSFVERVTLTDGPQHVPPAQRIAVFDNDGTLWAEQPVYFQVAFALDQVKAMAPQHPEWKDTQPFKAVIESDPTALAASGEKGVLEVMAVSHAGMTTDAFSKTVSEWLAWARHPRFSQPYDRLVYQPQLELLAYLRANAFKTFIVSGGGVEFMRVFAERTYGIPPEQVVGSSGMVKYQIAANGKPVLIKEPKVEFIDDGSGKPVGINRFIGRRPIFAFGNSDGDYEMLRWTAAGNRPRFIAILHHTDAAREYAYDRQAHIGKLDKALDEARARGWTVVDMKSAWKQVFAFEKNASPSAGKR